MRIDLHCHTKATKTGDSPKRNIESDKFKEKVNGVGVEIIELPIIMNLIMNNT